MARLEIANAEVYFRTVAELLASGEDDKRISRKVGCSRSEAKRLRQSFTATEIVEEDKLNTENLDAWLDSSEGQRAQKQWEGQHRQHLMGGIGQGQKGGISKPTPGKKQWNRQKV